VEAVLLPLPPHHGTRINWGRREAGARGGGAGGCDERVIGRPRSAQGFTTGVGEKRYYGDYYIKYIRTRGPPP
jgi:hypothetical protein